MLLSTGSPANCVKQARKVGGWVEAFHNSGFCAVGAFVKVLRSVYLWLGNCVNPTSGRVQPCVRDSRISLPINIIKYGLLSMFLSYHEPGLNIGNASRTLLDAARRGIRATFRPL